MDLKWRGPLQDLMPEVIAQLQPVALGALPTPVRRLSVLEQQLGHNALYVKCDHESSALYGGNKVRKLEFLLGEARRKNARAVLTLGGSGSNHVLATALHGRTLGLATVGVVFPQPDSPWVRRNQMAGRQVGLEVFAASSRLSFPWRLMRTLWQKWREDNAALYFVPGGGSSPLGSLGFVNAGLELAAQVHAGLLPEPDLVFVALGTGGTCAGLALGFHLAGLRTRVRAVRVVDRWFATRSMLRRLTGGMLRLIEGAGGALPTATEVISRIELEHGYYGPGYGYATDAGRSSCALFVPEGITLETTYTGKTAAAFLDEARRNPRPLLFWNTFSSAHPCPEG